MQRRTFLGLPGAALALAGCERPESISGGFTGINDQRGHALRDRRQSLEPTTTRRTQILIAGAGVAGLAAARALRLRGMEDFVLMELEDGAGGNARGGQLSGMPCPLGAHYLPVPGDDAHEVQDLLEELGLRQRVAGRWHYAEQHLVHSPQERLFFHDTWQDGLLPVDGVSPATLEQYQRFAQRVHALSQAGRFSIPASRTAFTAEHAALDAQTADHWLRSEGFDDPHLLWYLDYSCRDDYGAGLARVSAWACIHYFASRHGFHMPGEHGDGDDDAGTLTWPEGNGWLTKRLAAPLGDRLYSGHSVLRITEERQGVAVDTVNHHDGTVTRWQSAQCIIALPAFIAARVVQSPPAVLVETAKRMAYAPWLVANLHISSPLQDRVGAAPSWDNVVYGEAGGGLGYVDARHQSLDPTPGPTVLTYYRAPGDTPDARQQLLRQPWTHWRDVVVSALSIPHPDLAERLTRMDITRYGHAMAIPTPGTQQYLLGKIGRNGVRSGRLHFAHADWSGYSIFEEAFTRGHMAGLAV
ncbi:FAD-dependent oxidoreductase [Ottowia thiooxydans]|uniref:Monoamine oxidase n=1 Tax=Ottowia thiooxydans TaxID=219182 RepID=A0ABV2Q2N9_9BURK